MLKISIFQALRTSKIIAKISQKWYNNDIKQRRNCIPMTEHEELLMLRSIAEKLKEELAAKEQLLTQSSIP